LYNLLICIFIKFFYWFINYATLFLLYKNGGPFKPTLPCFSPPLRPKGGAGGERKSNLPVPSLLGREQEGVAVEKAQQGEKNL
jgi:hypothetical protein